MFFLIAASCLIGGSAFASTYYFSATGSDTNAGTSASPWLNPGSHNANYHAGDFLMVAAGTYTPTYGWGLQASGNSAGGYITIQCAPNQTSKIVVTTANQNGVLFYAGASYWDLKGCDFSATGSNGTAILVNGDSIAPTANIHHILIEGNYAHDSSCEGIGVAGNSNGGHAVDYITIRNNTVYNNARTSGYHCSGIAIYDPIALDTGSGYHLIVQGNVSYGNNDCDTCGTPTDGNGIILDSYGTYAPSTLVSHNLVYQNGGRGIHAFFANNVTIDSNTSWRNMRDNNICGGTVYEIGTYGSTFITVTNNEAQSFDALACSTAPIVAYGEFGTGTATGDIFDYNTGSSIATPTYSSQNSPGFTFGAHNTTF